ncbi:uncharacterized protein PFLUO_LOCUS1660 [Penicillium psychrofluorescens]|uniref:uncharacterized protein n=1 Tax=Penicillium psychrofluorescens TaxID=3158075 RepID=UPI003CCE0096
MAPPTVIVFGPTGNVGSAAACHAQQLGAKVVLALRDPHKPIPGLSPDQEKAGGFERVQADLTKPETIKAAVCATRAKHAFIHLLFDATDYMRSTIEALKDAGIEFVVFLSSVSVHGDIREITPASFVSYAHAQAEVGLDEVFGPDGYVALRPAYFNTNAAWWANMIRDGEVRIAYPDAELDWIAPEDIGRVAGTLLVRGIQATEGAEARNSIPLCGPKLVSQRDAVGIFGRAIGKDVKVTELDEQEGVQVLLKHGVPEFVVGPLVNALGARSKGEGDHSLVGGEIFETASANIPKYAGRATSLEEWAETHKGVFGG